MLENAIEFNLRGIIYLNILGVNMPLDPLKFYALQTLCAYINMHTKLCRFTHVIVVPSAVPVNKSLLRACN